jgi:NTP pyrophosphatase (non-canonical NTP hydrolase)
MVSINTEGESGMNLNRYAIEVHKANQQWWIDLKTGLRKERNIGELLMLCVSELAEAMEGDRKNLPDDKLPHRAMFDVELVDCLIRIFDIAGSRGVDLETIYIEKMKFNSEREDHKAANRIKEHGKKY